MSKAAGTSGKMTSSCWVWHSTGDLVRLVSVKGCMLRFDCSGLGRVWEKNLGSWYGLLF